MLAPTAPVCELTVLAWRLGALTLTDLWWRYIGLSGNHSADALSGYLDGTTSWPACEHNVLAQVLNERLWELGFPSLVPIREPRATGSGPAHRRGGRHG